MRARALLKSGVTGPEQLVSADPAAIADIMVAILSFKFEGIDIYLMLMLGVSIHVFHTRAVTLSKLARHPRRRTLEIRPY